jgi:hypothetical protein
MRQTTGGSLPIATSVDRGASLGQRKALIANLERPLLRVIQITRALSEAKAQ